MKLLDITEFYSPLGGGVRTYLAEKARWLAREQDVEHVVLVSSNRDAVEQWHRSRVYHVAGPAAPASPGYHLLWSGRRVSEIVRRERPDVIELGSLYFAPWLLQRATRGMDVRRVCFLHEDARACYVDHLLRRAPRAARTLAGRLLERYLARALASCDAGLAATPQGGATLARLAVRDVTVVPLGVDASVFDPARRDPAWRAEIGAAPDQPVALYVGRLSTEKCLDVLLAALPRLHQTTRLRLVLMGEGHLRRRFERQAQRAPEMLRVLPYEPDRARVARAYASADLFIAPCPYETFGLAALEAMASGLPVAGVAAGGIGALLEAEADWGRTYRVGDVRDCARAVEELVRGGDRRGAGRQARALVLERYTWDRTFSALVALYRRLASERARPARVASTAPRAAPSINV